MGEISPNQSPTSENVLHQKSSEGAASGLHGGQGGPAMGWELATVPAWSGDFCELAEEGLALMAVHMDDTRTHYAPPGWKLIEVEHHDDSQVFVYQRTEPVVPAPRSTGE